jgi:hypothetical protein
MNEKDFESIICKYPVLIEDGLSLMGRQVYVKGKRVDMVFKDKRDHTLIVELKKGTIIRDHISQLLDYEGYFLSGDDPNVRVMLVGNRVPPNLRRSLDHHGFEWKELPITHLSAFLKEQDDAALMQCIANEESLTGKASTKFHDDQVKADPQISKSGFITTFDEPNPTTLSRQKSLQESSKTSSIASGEKLVTPMVGRKFLEEKYSFESRLEVLSPELRPIFFEFHDRLIAAIGSTEFMPRTHMRGLTYRTGEREAYIWVNFGRNTISLNFYTGSEEIRGLQKATWSKGGDRKGSLFQIQTREDISLAVEYGKQAYKIALKEKGIKGGRKARR